MRPKTWILLVVFALIGLNTASAQDDYDYTDEDLPEFIEDFGYEDADYSGPELGDAAASSQGNRRAGSAGQYRCRNCDCICCRATLFGDCGGHRTCLQQSGIIYRGRVTQFFLGVGGGINDPVPPPLA